MCPVMWFQRVAYASTMVMSVTPTHIPQPTARTVRVAHIAMKAHFLAI